MEKAQGFEITDYSEEHKLPTATISSILEIVKDTISENPAVNVGVTFSGKLMRLTYRSYEMGYPQKKVQVERDSKMILDEMVKNIKSEFKKRNKEALKLVEKKEMAQFDVQRVSINDRYLFASWRFYEID